MCCSYLNSSIDNGQKMNLFSVIIVNCKYCKLSIVNYLANSAITIERLLANNFTAKANKMTPKNLRKMKMMSLPNHFSILPTKRITI